MLAFRLFDRLSRARLSHYFSLFALWSSSDLRLLVFFNGLLYWLLYFVNDFRTSDKPFKFKKTQ